MGQLRIEGKEYDIQELRFRDLRKIEQADRVRAQRAKEDPEGFAESFDYLSESLIGGVPLRDIAAVAGIPLADLEDMKPSDIKLIVNECRVVNPDFFALVDQRSRLFAAHMANSTGSAVS